MLSKTLKLPLPVNGLKSTSSISSVGIPNALKIGESRWASKAVMPLALNKATAIIIEAMYGNISTTKGIDFFAPFIKVINSNNNNANN